MSIATALIALDTQRDNLAANLVTKGVAATNAETLAQLVPKVLNITSGGEATGPQPVLKLDGIDNTGSGHNASATTWKDLSGTVADAVKVAGNTTWGDKYLRLDGNSYWNVNAPNYSRGTIEIVISIDTDFAPVNTTYWYSASCIFGCELGGSQRDFGILVNSSGKFAVGYLDSTIWSSAINAKDGLPHTITFTYFRGPIKLAIDGVTVCNFGNVASGTECTVYGIGWNKNSSATKVKGNIYSAKWFNEFLTDAQIADNHAANKAYYGF